MSHVGIKTRRIANGTAGIEVDGEPPWQPEHLAAWDIDRNEPLGSLRAIAAAAKCRSIMEASRGRTAAVGQEVQPVSVNNGAQRTLF